MDGAEYAKVMQEKLELVAELKEQHASMRSENWRLAELLSSLVMYVEDHNREGGADDGAV